MEKKKKELNDVRFFKKELKGIQEIKEIKRQDVNLINIKLNNNINIAIDFTVESWVVAKIRYKYLDLRHTGVTDIWELEKIIKSYGAYNQEFLENLLQLKTELEKFFYYELDFYLEEQFLSIHFNTHSNNIDRLNIKFNNDTIEIKLIYNIRTNESGLVNDMKDINKEKARKTELIKEVIETIFNKEVKINNTDYIALEKERIFNFIGDVTNAMSENNQVVFDEIVEEFLRDLD